MSIPGFHSTGVNKTAIFSGSRRKWRLLYPCAALLVFCASCVTPNQPPVYEPPAFTAHSAPVTTAATAQIPVLKALYERDAFLTGMSGPHIYPTKGRLAGGLVPHHLLASQMIAGFFSMAAAQPQGYDRVVIVAPSHFPENCSSDVVTAIAHWDTPWGSVSGDTTAAGALLDNPDIQAENNPTAVEQDHGVAGLIPFVGYYLPNTSVTVCLLSNRLSRQRLEAVWQEIADLCARQSTLLVASVDCSHYLMPQQAAEKDQQTAQAIAQMDFPQILQFTDSNIDSPQAVSTLLYTAQSQNCTLDMLDHWDSSQILPHAMYNPVYLEGITSYYVYAAWLPVTDTPPPQTQVE